MEHIHSPGRRASSRRHAQRLSSDSSVTQASSSAYPQLPAYSAQAHRRSISGSVYSDKPPDYHQSHSADEGDLDDSDHEPDRDYFTRAPASPFRKRAFAHPSRRASPQQTSSSQDPLDALLARSVHALEMSNVLLQSTMNTRSSLSASMAHDRLVDRNLELSATVLDTRIRNASSNHAHWMDGLDEVVRDVHDLYADTESLSRSLPSGSVGGSSPPPIHALGRRIGAESTAAHRRRSSHSRAYEERPQLRLSSSPPREPRHFMSPPPRAMTQYVSVASERGDAEESTADPGSIFMPSTIGLQSSSHISSFRAVAGHQRRPDALRLLHSNSSTPGFIQYGRYDSVAGGGSWSAGGHRRSRPSVASPRSAGPTRTSYTSSSPSRRSLQYSSDSQRPVQLEWHQSRSSLSPRHARSRSSSEGSVRGRSRSRSKTPSVRSSRSDSANTVLLHKPVLPPARAMTPPIEESPGQSSSDTSGPDVSRTLESLRKILDEAPKKDGDRPRPAQNQSKRPSFLSPKTPSVTPVASTSTATATVSRLFTKGTHSSRETPPSRPSLKPGNASPRDSMSFSSPSSGRSTPRQVVFAQLPAPYSAEGTRRGFEKNKSKSKQAEKQQAEPGFWSMLLGAVNPPSALRDPSARMEDRVEDRMARSWARSGSGQSTMEDFLY